MHARRNFWVASYPGRMALGTRLTPGLPRNIFCDATTDFMNEWIAKADWNSMYKRSKGCRVHWVCRAWVGREVHRFRTSSWGEVPWVLWQTFQPQSQSLVFLSLELEITVVALLTTLTCDQLTQSVVYLQDTDIIYGRLLSAWERVQFISLTVQFKRPWSYWCW